MPFILRHKISRLYIDCNGDNHTYRNLYDPKEASVFNTKKEALKWATENIADSKDYIEAVTRSKAITTFNEWLSNGMLHHIKDKINPSLSRPYNNEDRIEVLNWWIEVESTPEDRVRYEDYQTWPELYSKFKYIFSIDSYGIDYDDDNYSRENPNYITFSLAF